MVASASVIVLALLVRLLTPSNLRRLARGDLPEIRRGRLSIMGQELEISPVAESRGDEHAVALERRVNDAEDRIDKLTMVVDILSGKRMEEGSERA